MGTVEKIKTLKELTTFEDRFFQEINQFARNEIGENPSIVFVEMVDDQPQEIAKATFTTDGKDERKVHFLRTLNHRETYPLHMADESYPFSSRNNDLVCL